MMGFKVITFITICAVHSRILPSVLGSEQKLFNRHLTFPMVFRLVKLHHRYSKENSFTSLLRSVRSANPNFFQEIQYAPLYEDFSQNKKEKLVMVHKSKKNTLKPTLTPALKETTKVFPEAKTGHLFGKSHLEPRTDATCVKCYDQGHKDEISTQVNRSPGHNAVYKLIFPEALPTHEERKSKNVDYVKPIGINLNLESLTTTTTTTTAAPPVTMVEIASVEKKDNRPVKFKDPYMLNPVDHLVINSKSIKNKRFLPYAKYHRLHLNIARVYSPGQLPLKQPPLPFKNLGRRNKYGQVYAPQTFKLMSQSQNTRLYPVRHHRKAYRLRPSNLKMRNAKYT